MPKLWIPRRFFIKGAAASLAAPYADAAIFSFDANGAIDPWTNLDGRLNAPSGTPRLSTLLNGYHPVGTTDGRYYLGTGGGFQPPWRVAGVDYAVGYPDNIVLKDPASISLAGVNVNTRTKTIDITEDDVTLDGYDFTQYIINTDRSRTKISNSRFRFTSFRNVGSRGFIDGRRSKNLTISYCSFDGTNMNVSDNRAVLCSDDFIMEYCNIANMVNDGIDCNSATYGGKFYIHHTLFNEVAVAGSGHGDPIQFVGVNTANWDVQFYFNTMVQHQQVNQSNGCYVDAGGGATMANPLLHHNTVVTYDSGPGHGGAPGNPGGWAYSYCFRPSHVGATVTGGSLNDNWCDASGCIEWRISDSSFPPTMTIKNNMNMVDGTVLT